jgi:hypothetical protein
MGAIEMRHAGPAITARDQGWGWGAAAGASG